MTAVLLQTKLRRPTLRPGLIPRAHLHARMSSGLWSSSGYARKLTLVAAPAGFGKSTLVAGWTGALPLDERPEICWLSLDEGDDNPVRFLDYVFAALRRVVPQLGQSAQALLEAVANAPASTDPAADALPTALAEALSQAINEIAIAATPIVLVLDDYHVLHSPIVHRLVTLLLDRQPANLHLVIASRTDPALPLTRLRARGQLLELRARDLRLTEAEAAAFLATTMGLDLRPDWVAALERRTEGWIAGLQLAALSLQGHEDPAAFIEAFSGSHRYVIDYLVDEVLNHQAPPIRDFLVQTAVVDQVCAPLCDALLGQDSGSSQAMLEYLERANLFLIPLDDSRQWYRYHALFADSLRSVLDSEQRSALHRRAARWFSTHGRPAEAVYHARATGDLTYTADTIERAIQQTAAWSRGQVTTLVGWLDALPDAILDERPALCLHIAEALYLTGHIARSEQLLDRATRLLTDYNDDRHDTHGLQALAEITRGAIAIISGDVQTAIRCAQEGLAHLPEPETHPHARARAYDILGTAFQYQGDARAAEQHYLQAGALAQAAGLDYLAISARCEAAEMQMLQGRLQAAAETGREALSLGNASIPPHGRAWAALGEIALEQNDLATAATCLADGLGLAQQGGLTNDVVTTLHLTARLKQSQNDTEGARGAWQEAVRILRSYGIERLTRNVATQQARFDLAQGRLEEATRWADATTGAAHNPETESQREVEDLTLARVLLATGEPDRARTILDRVGAQARAGGRNRRDLEAQLLTAVAFHREGREIEAQDALRHAVVLAAPDRWLRLFLDEGIALLPLLSAPSVHNAAPAFVDGLLAILRGPDPGASASPPEGACIPTTGETLSERELEILRLVAEGHSNREIGQTLYIGLGTVKWYLTHLYDKLDVGSRGLAVARARELGLIA